MPIGRQVASAPVVEHIPALILAGGRGTRLQPVLGDRPKVLAPINGRPFLSFLLDKLVRDGLQRVLLCTGHRAQQVQEVFGSSYGPLEIGYSVEREPLGTAGALRHALPLFDEPVCLVLNGDSYIDTNLNDFIAWHSKHHFAASLVLSWACDASRFGATVVEKGGAIRDFREKDANASPGWINAGVYLISRTLLELLPGGEAISIERECFPKWIQRGLGGFCQRTAFIDLGTPASFRKTESFFLRLGAIK